MKFLYLTIPASTIASWIGHGVKEVGLPNLWRATSLDIGQQTRAAAATFNSTMLAASDALLGTAIYTTAVYASGSQTSDGNIATVLEGVVTPSVTTASQDITAAAASGSLVNERIPPENTTTTSTTTRPSKPKHTTSLGTPVNERMPQSSGNSTTPVTVTPVTKRSPVESAPTVSASASASASEPVSESTSSSGIIENGTGATTGTFTTSVVVVVVSTSTSMITTTQEISVSSGNGVRRERGVNVDPPVRGAVTSQDSEPQATTCDVKDGKTTPKVGDGSTTGTGTGTGTIAAAAVRQT
ncbi:hypothetical protein UCREL1_8119 [Eutypa lata UCREL1]|uniref:Uncharacterized protein n=1 Tax=Eutypa lata (strain UCR-EL1) TaxID=1287681 RepID=M7SF56_EUTLA|nr:hypothetical protein UCREL1_8119 [Eutypa lata UCREL1]